LLAQRDIPGTQKAEMANSNIKNLNQDLDQEPGGVTE
jgi:hypothetical protein